MNPLTVFLFIVLFLFNGAMAYCLILCCMQKPFRWKVVFIFLGVTLFSTIIPMAMMLESALYQGPENLDLRDIMGAIIEWGMPAIFIATSVEMLAKEAKIAGISFLRNLLYSACFFAGLLYYSYWSIIIVQFILKTNELPH